MAKKQDNKSEIFDEMDKVKKRKPSCTCGTMLILLLVLLVGLSIFVLFLISMIKARVNIPVIQPNLAARESLFKKLEKFTGNKTKTGPAIEISEQELTSLMAYSISQNDKLPIINPQSAITPDKIIVSGTLTKPLKSDIQFWLVPSVKNGKIEAQVTKITAGKISLPDFIVQAVSGILADTLEKALSQGEQIPVNSITLKTGLLVIQ